MRKINFVDLKKQYLNHKKEIDDSIFEVINNTAFISGEFAKKFEDEFSLIYGVKNCVSTANGTDSLYVIMKALDIGYGDEVITVSNSWISSSETISQTGAKPVFVDIEGNTHSIDANKIEDKITSKTKAIIIVHLHGQMCEMNKIIQISKKHNLKIIEDCAQSHFSEFEGLKAGTIGDAGAFSFYPGKNLGAYGDAGCIITNNEDLAIKCRKIANHGSLIKHHHEIEGINSRLDGIQANILRVKLKYILDWTNQRILAARLYNNYLSSLDEIKTPIVRENTKHTFHVYQIEVKSNRDELINFLNEKGIPTSIHYPKPLPFLECYEKYNYTEIDFPVVSKLNKKIISLPIFPEIEKNQIEYICNSIKEFYEKNRNY